MAEEKRSTVVSRTIQRRAKAERDALLNVAEADAFNAFLESHSSSDGASSSAPVSDTQDNTQHSPATDTSVPHPPTPDHSSVAPEPSLIEFPTTRLESVYSECSDCEPSSDDEHDSEIASNSLQLPARLREWYIQSKADLSQLNLLLKCLKPFHPELPVDARTIVRTPRSTVVKQLENGTYVHVGLKSGLVSQLLCGFTAVGSCLEIDINCDGIPLSKSSDSQAWPILARCFNLTNSCKPFVVGIFCGSGKPSPLEEYLSDYISELKSLMKYGFKFEGVKYSVKVRCYICDSPARAYLKCIKGHTGYSGCERCIDEGEYLNRRMCFEPCVKALRTDDSFDRQEDENHHHGISPLSVLGTAFVSMFVLDPMHLIFHGVLKRFMLFLVKKSRTNAKLSALQIYQISQRLEAFSSCIPREFSRKPRSLSCISRWKATELRLFLLYTGIVAMKGILPDELYKLFLLFHVATRIVSTPALVTQPQYIDYAQDLFSTFVRHCHDSSVFGDDFCVYNVHSILHLHMDVRQYGVISNFSAFPFENQLGVIKRMVRSGNNIPQQIAHRLAEMDGFLEPLSSGSDVFVPSGFIASTNKFKTLKCNGFTLSSTSSRDCYFSSEGGIGKLKEIVDSNGDFLILADMCDQSHIDDYFEYPTNSRKVGVYKFYQWTRSNVVVNAKAVTGKFLVMQAEGGSVAVQLLHTIV